MKKKKIRWRFMSVLLSVLMLVTMAVPSLEVFADDVVAGEGHLSITANSATLNGVEIADGTKVKDGDILKLQFAWTLPTDYAFTPPITFTYDLSPQLKGITLSEQVIDVMNDAGNAKIAEYKVSGSTLYIKLLDGSQSRKGDCMLEGEIDLDKADVDSNGDFTFKFFDKVLALNAPETVPAFNVSKTAGDFRLGDDGSYYQDFTVTVRGANVDAENVIINDIFPTDSGSMFDTDKLTNVSINNVAHADITAGSDVNIGTVSKDYNNPTIIKYSVKVNSTNALNPSLSYDEKKNKVSVKYNNEEKTNTTTTANPSVPAVSKSGNYVEDTENGSYIEWTITVTPNMLGMDKTFTLKDLADTKLSADDIVKAVSGATKNADGSVSIPSTAFTKGTDKYTLTYKTPVDSKYDKPISQVNFTNKADVTFTDVPYTYTGTGSANIPAVAVDYIDKSNNGADGDAIEWSVDVFIPDNDNITSVTITDNTGEWNSDNSKHEIDYSSFVVTLADGQNKSLSEVIDVTSNNSTYGIFALKADFIKANQGKHFTITYNTDMTTSKSLTYVNKASINIQFNDGTNPISDDDTDKYTAEISAAKKEFTDFGMLEVNKDNYFYPLAWKLEILTGNHSFAAGDVFTVADTMPKGYEYIDGSARMSVTDNMYYVDFRDKTYADCISASTEAVGENSVTTFTVTLNDALAAKLNSIVAGLSGVNLCRLDIGYATAMTAEAAINFSSKEQTASFTNSADVKSDGKDIDTVSATQSATSSPEKFADKSVAASGKLVDEVTNTTRFYADYKIEINKAKLVLGDGVTDLTAIDTLGTRLTLDETTMVIKGENGESGSYVYDADAHTITFTLKDKVHYTITYRVYVRQIGLTTENTDEQLKDKFSNTICVKGKGETSINDNVMLSKEVYRSEASYEYDEDATYITISGTKTWSDVNNNAARPKKISLVITQTKTAADNKVTKVDTSYDFTAETATDNSWSYEIDNLITKGSDGATYTYAVKELLVDGYAVSYKSNVAGITGTDGYAGAENEEIAIAIENKFTAVEEEVGNLTVTKDWDDNDNISSARPSEITITVTDETNTYTKSAKLKAGETSVTFTDLPLYTYSRDTDDKLVRTPRKYTVTETADGVDKVLLGYYTPTNPGEFTLVSTSTVPQTTPTKAVTIKNSFEGVTSVSGTKTWVDTSNSAGYRPTSLTVTLSANGQITNKTPVWKNTNSDVWTYTFADLPKYTVDAAGKLTEISYTTAETCPTAYTSEQTGLNFKNTLKNETVNVTGTKVWANDNADLRPSTITVKLLADGVETDLTPEWSNKDTANWSYAFNNLPKYKYTKVGTTVTETAINYTVSENKVDNYSTTISGYTITNTYVQQTTSVSGTKTWVGDTAQIRPDSIILTLYANDIAVNSAVCTWKNTDTAVWTYAYDNLPATDSKGDEITYTVKETPVDDYIVSYNGNNITNTYNAVSISGTKTWTDNSNANGIRPDTLTVILSANGLATNYVPQWTNTDKDVWTYTFTNLPKYSVDKDMNMTEIEYSVEETCPVGYTSSVSGNNFTNTIKSDKITVNGTKTWANDNTDLRPSTITVKLLADGTETAYTPKWTNTSSNVWSYSFENVPKYSYTKDKNGVVVEKEIVYTVSENSVDDYQTTISGFNITNTYVESSVDVSGTKTWTGDNADVRPAAVELTLYANGNKVDNAACTWENKDTDVWTYTFDNLPEKDDKGAVITYTVEETAVEGYITSYNGNNITNTYNVTEVSGTKTWADNSNEYGIRPDSLTVTLSADGKPQTLVPQWTNTDTDVWTYTFANLPKYNVGENGTLTEIVYTAAETCPAGYTASQNGFNFTNSSVTTKVLVTKTDMTGENEIAGAFLQVIDKDTNEVVDEWYSTTDAHEILGLVPGKTYTLHEEGAPDGYAYAADADFTVSTDGSVDEITIKDDTTKVKISKTDLTGENEIAGALLQLIDKDTGKTIDQWYSTTEAHEFNGVLIAGKTYTLHEEGAPDGYAYATDVDFTVSTDGSVDTVVMKDDVTKVSVSKTDVTGEKELEGATLQIIDKLTGEVVDKWVSTDEAHQINGLLIAGNTYILHEELAPVGYALATDIEFTVNLDGTVNTVVMVDELLEESSSDESSDVSSSDESSDVTSSDESSDVSSSDESSDVTSSDESSDVTSSDESSESSSNDSSSSSSSSSTSSQTTSSTTTTESKTTSSSSTKTPNTGMAAGGAMALSALAFAVVIVSKKKNDK